MDKISYKDSGVNIDEGNSLVADIKNLAKSTFNKNVIGGIGSFSGAYALPANFKNPVLLGASDGVGTKLKIAIDSNRLDSVGIDLVAMCVNDLICNFGTPLFFLDYYATAKLDKSKAIEIIKGIVEGCKEANCVLIGGESAEMPGMYKVGDFDLAGFAIGVVEREIIEAESNIKVGDILIALPSSGLHSNGYSLARKICFDKLKLSFDEKIDNENLIDILLKPTKIYVKTFEILKSKIKALAHITGGGIAENLPRIFTKDLGAKIEKSSIKSHNIFNLFSKYVEQDELYRTFNMGVGMILVADKNNVDYILKNSDGYIIGEVDNSSNINIV
ncbi:phosphoribosylformylglycinamidine cyclo-ligase [Helicobacter sp. MIT 14-3879]|uniref:phosphoribosylformylglycinamidine cyclo-ligase n=1 Tax=Helicobacter sp. MIT 14-3879 TaxID=2040649 RepID=UPI000E1E486C|nr:phosphoribosylformylglycinamidine cyclo-ligase [Helicobacter sp. MIT 14-3879]RDU64704.1 phosphoribosylformylglycinamidine cyclo-ligase [Helicobacter sp. MIT 14-3879]